MFDVIPFNETLHRSQVNSWAEQHGVPLDPYTPKVGFIIPDFCAVWLIDTEANFFIGDCLIKNPKANSRDSLLALKTIVSFAVDYADTLGKDILMWTKYPSVVRMCSDAGFVGDGIFRVMMRLSSTSLRFAKQSQPCPSNTPSNHHSVDGVNQNAQPYIPMACKQNHSEQDEQQKLPNEINGAVFAPQAKE